MPVITLTTVPVSFTPFLHPSLIFHHLKIYIGQDRYCIGKEVNTFWVLL